MYRTSPTQLRKRSPANARSNVRADAVGVETLESRTHLAAHAVFIRGAGLLAVFGDDAANDLAVGRDAAGAILVNGGALHVFGGTPTVANTRSVRLFGFGGNDHLALDETAGPLPKATLFGGAGDDVLTGGSGGDLIFAEAGNDTVLGMGGPDLIVGGSGGDTLTGGAGDDNVFGQSGDDRLLWNPGDGTDLNEGGAGNDQAIVNGGGAGERFTAARNGTRVRFDRTDPAPFSLDIGGVETLTLNANAGDDAFSGSNGLAGLIHLTVNGGVGNDTLVGSDGADDLIGRDGDDIIDGRGGNDLVLMGDGDDVFTWNPGDGSDVVEGQNGNDTMVFNGSNLAERIDVSANGSRARVARDLGNIVMDVNGLERVDVNALGGADTVTVNDLSGTEITAVNTDPGPAADGAADAVIVNGTDGTDTIGVRLSPVSVTGLHALVTIANAGTADSLTVNAGGGDDNVNAANPVAFGLKLIENGGAGNDTLVGSRGDDTLIGGDGDDFFLGFRGSDTALMGAGDDTFEWDPGDGSDVIDGQGDHDTMLFIGSNDDEGFDLSPNGNRARLVRTVANAGNVTMDLTGVEQVDLPARGGADTVVVNDLTATDVTTLNVDLDSAEGTGAGDNTADSVTINGTAGDDGVQVAAFDKDARVVVAGLFPFLNITGSDGPNDRLTINTLGGVDGVDAASLPAGLIGLTIVGGAANDVLLGSAGGDTFVWNPGDGSDRIEGQGGRDALSFNGSDDAETFGISANGNRVRLSRDLGTVTMDVNDVERLDLSALNGADKVVVNDLAGTDVGEINLSLAAVSGGNAGDGQVDSVVVNGGADGELIPVLGTAGGIMVNGAFAEAAALQYFMVIRAVDSADMLQINGNGGNDSIDAGGLQTPVKFRAEGGAGDDILRGSPGDDVLLGGDGEDGIDGNGGADSAFLGAGNDLFIWDPGDGSDAVEGQDGADSLIFRGSNGGETINLSANGNRLRLDRAPGNVVMDVDDVERVDVIAQGGPDNVFVNDLAGTDVVAVNINLGAGGSANGDLLADAVAVSGSSGADRIVVTDVAGVAEVIRPTTLVRITGADPAFDTLTVDGLAGNDTVDASGLTPGIISLGIVGGAGDDDLIGSAGDDALDGGFGNDQLHGGPGDDVLIGGPGVDILDGGTGTNTLIQD